MCTDIFVDILHQGKITLFGNLSIVIANFYPKMSKTNIIFQKKYVIFRYAERDQLLS